jgi:hypothetical protein
MAMDAIVATIVDGGRAIVDIDREVGRNYSSLVQPLLQRLSGVPYVLSIKTKLLEG